MADPTVERLVALYNKREVLPGKDRPMTFDELCRLIGKVIRKG